MDPAELWVGGWVGMQDIMVRMRMKILVKTECTGSTVWYASHLSIYLLVRPRACRCDHKSASHKVSHTPQNTITRVPCAITSRAHREDACVKENEDVTLFVSAAGPTGACNRLRGSRKNCQFEGVSTLPVFIQVNNSMWNCAASVKDGFVWAF